MNVLKKNFVPVLFALAGVLFLIPAVVKPVTKGEPLDNALLAIALMFLTLAVVFFATGRKSGGGSGPPSA